jgi:hypothetical protein
MARNPARQKRNTREHQADRHVNNWLHRAHAVKQCVHHARYHEGAETSGYEAHDGEKHSFAQDEG